MLNWRNDEQARIDPAVLTDLLHTAVPVLRFVNWRILETAEGYARTLLPLTAASSNQHSTHQAALLALAADYTGGVALTTLLHGTPIIGVHPQPDDGGAALWLGRLSVTFTLPSAGDVVLTSCIPPESAARVRRRYAAGQTVVEQIDILLETGGEVVARATLSYVLRQARALKPTSPTGSISPLYGHRVRSSARLIAGLRALEAGMAQPLFVDPYASRAAGTQGHLLAQRFTTVLPQVATMVANRTRAIDDLLVQSVAAGTRQIVVVGAGLDFRAHRLLGAGSDVTVFELDLPIMLTDRLKVLATLGPVPALARVSVAINLEVEDLADRLLASGRFEPTQPTLFIVEGLSMYFDAGVNRRIFSALRRMLQHPESRLWTDIVAQAVIAGTTGLTEVEAFVRGMEALGEPFIFGVDDPIQYFTEVGYATASVTPSDAYRRAEHPDPVFALYRFCLLRGTEEE
jgi:methyltransferase (TIGR00027 family)